MDTTEYEALKALLGKIQSGLESEKEAALGELYERVHNSDDDRAWNLLGIGLLQTGRYTDAVEVFSFLNKNQPDNDLYRANLAASFSYAGQFELARFHYQYLADQAKTEEGRDYGRKGLASIQQALKEEENEKTYIDLQVAALLERRAQGEAGPNHYHRLAFIYLQREQTPEPPATLAEITALLEEGLAKYPQSIDILELLALCYSRTRNDDRLEATLRSIERIDPDHRVLQIFQNQEEQAVEKYENEMNERAFSLLNQMQSQDQAIRQAALADLRSMVTMFPANGWYRSVYGLALALNGRKADAIRQAEIAAETAGEDHSTHFHLGQIFWNSGDPDRGRKHLELSHRYAGSDEERRDVSELIAHFESERQKK